MLEHKEIVWPDAPIDSIHKDIWQAHVQYYEEMPGDFFAAWHYVNNHPAFWYFPQFKDGASEFLVTQWGFGGLGIRTAAGKSDAVQPRYTAPEVFPAVAVDVFADGGGTYITLEAGRISLYPDTEHVEQNTHYHDYELDVSASTYEAAVITLARLIWGKYGNDRRVADKED